MAVDPTIRFQHIWHALMRVLGDSHRTLYRRNKAILQDVKQLMGRK